MKILLDSYAIIELLTGSEKGIRVKNLINEDNKTYTTVLNLYEVKYRLIQKMGENQGLKLLNEIGPKLRILPITLEASLMASEVKLKHPLLGAVDCVSYSMALTNKLVFVTGDEDFEGMQGVISL